MPPLNAILVFTAAAFIMNRSPGPANFYVMARTIAQGIPAGLAAVAGLAVGGLLHVVAVVLGLWVLFIYSPLAYTILKTAGATHLVYLDLGYFGVRFFAKDNEESLEGSELEAEKLARLAMRKIFIPV